ncbi:HAD family phosphatase [Streptomyces sp. H27-C3]|uniref:HAD family phosphatase n=1 Tax=Streptomyces sp. H27-C3 TaxID=3046305 RepID=UPI0024BB034A|nr:HAD family phosphatase [Streptomyces sp. H27-C3]MDJ0466757.1 HAD family phosphatase [Streptomyces sp. H27-C3]
MSERLSHLRLAAVNIDGVLLNDSFSPVIHHFIVSRGGTYTPDIERRIFSQPRSIAGRRMAEVVQAAMTGQEALDAYFAERAAYLEKHPVFIQDGAIDMMRRLKELGLQTVCYGGLDKTHFDEHLGTHAGLFDGPGYVCTNDFRPGIAEITMGVFGLAYDQVLFIDDVAAVAQEARSLDVPFIGHPSSFSGSFQRQLMQEAGVRHLVDSLHAVDEDRLRTVDAEAATRTVWAG